MNRLDPEHARRLRRTRLLSVVALGLGGVAYLLLRPGVDAPIWLWLPISVSYCVLGIVDIVLMFAIVGEVRRTRRQ